MNWLIKKEFQLFNNFDSSLNVLLCVELLGTIFLEQKTPLILYIQEKKVLFGILCAKYSFPINELFIIFIIESSYSIMKIMKSGVFLQ